MSQKVLGNLSDIIVFSPSPNIYAYMHKCKRAIANVWFVFSKHVEKLTFHGFLSNQLLPKRSYSHPGERNHACVLSGRGLAEVNIEKSDIL